MKEQYHQSDNKAVDLEAIKQKLTNLFDTLYGTDPVTTYEEEIINLFKPYLSTPQKALSEGEYTASEFIDRLNSIPNYSATNIKIKLSDGEMTIGNISVKTDDINFQQLQSNQQEEIERLKNEYIEVWNECLTANTKIGTLEKQLSDLQGKMEDNAVEFYNWVCENTTYTATTHTFEAYKEFIKSKEAKNNFKCQICGGDGIYIDGDNNRLDCPACK